MPSKLLAELLDRVDNEELWSARVNDIHLWPIVRSTVLRTSLRRDELARGSSLPRTSASPSLMSRTRAVPEGLRSLRVTRTPRGDALFFVPTVLFVPERDGGRYVDRLYSEYYQRIRQPLIVELSSRGHKPRQRNTSGGEVVSFTSLWSMARARSVLGRRSSRDAGTISSFAGAVTSTFGLPPNMVDGLERTLTVFTSAYPHMSRALDRRLVHRSRRPVAFVHTASYLGLYGLIAKSLKDHGFRVVELQHGSTHGEHYAYHFSPEVMSTTTHPARSYLPDDLIVYGRHWAAQTTTPYNKVVVGYPYLTAKMQRASSIVSRPEQALLVLQGESTKETLPQIAAHLAGNLPKLNVVVKAHPGEAGDLARYDSLKQLPNVEVTADGNVYDLLAQSGIVIGYSSTVLYEASAFPDTRVFVLRNRYVPDGIGVSFSSADELVQMISEPQRGTTAIHPDELFDPDWQANLDSYLRSLDLPPGDP